MMDDTDCKRSIIASYGDLVDINQGTGDVRLNPRMVLESDGMAIRIYGHGINDDEAVSDVYSCLYNSFKIIVRLIEDHAS